MSTARRTSLTAAALVVATPLVVSCADRRPEARPTTVVTATTEAPEPLTAQVARREFRTFTINDDVARAAGDERLALTWVSDGESPLTAAEYRKAAFDGDPVRRYDYAEPKLYVPKLEPDVYPQWFVASVPRTVRGEAESTRTVLMAFILRAPGQRWTLSLRTVLAPKARQPKVVTDAGGYATALTTSDTSVLIRPREMPGIQATVASEGPDSVAAKVMRAGPVTTGYYEQSRKARRKARGKELTLQTVITATPYPIFPLRTEHGGGLVLYSLYRNSVTGVRDKEKEKGTKPPIPAEIEHLLDGTVEGNEIHVSETLQFAAYDPARPKDEDEDEDAPRPKADVIADAGGVYKAVTPPPKTP
ncbi:hypothetical protein [Actinomadura viridis]|uniref:DUF8094 domain-containing protein n=1 Tax=Actinomadura viridis TaxID=58110 RepID=A0A931DHC7_9ACTN|nr:hypothetical protein [Actinomadura viridis]MBG6086753.1 hypothetical protein [Actinomadura viridis]